MMKEKAILLYLIGEDDALKVYNIFAEITYNILK